MIKYKNQQYVNVFDKLPEDIRNVVSSYETTEHLLSIGKKHNLQIDQIGVMTDITFDVIMGIIATKNFVTEITNEIKVSPLEASTLVRDIDEEILKPIKKIMVALYEDGAPNRPSSSLVQYYEEDENHPSLDKNSLLKEIEDPTPVEVKKEIAEIKLRSLGGNKPIENLKTEPGTSIEEYHEEIQNNTSIEASSPKSQSLDTPSKLLSPSAPQLAPSDLLNKISEMKLHKTFVMPRKEDGNKPESLGLRSLKANRSTEAAVENNMPKQMINSAKPESNIKTETPKPASTTIDPYREKI
jgi:hypothetical protein